MGAKEEPKRALPSLSQWHLAWSRYAIGAHAAGQLSYAAAAAHRDICMAVGLEAGRTSGASSWLSFTTSARARIGQSVPGWGAHLSRRRLCAWYMQSSIVLNLLELRHSLARFWDLRACE